MLDKVKYTYQKQHKKGICRWILVQLSWLFDSEILTCTRNLQRTKG